MRMGDAPGIGTSADIKVGTTTITSGSSGRILYDNAGVLGEMTTTGSGTVVVLATGASLVTPALGVATATSLAIGGATIGSDALAVTGTSSFSGTITLASAAILAWNADTFIGRSSAAAFRLGATDAAVAVAQTISVQNVIAGTSNVAGANLTVKASQGTGSGAGGFVIFQVAPAGSSGTSQNALVNALEIRSSGGTTSGNILSGALITLGSSIKAQSANAYFTMDVSGNAGQAVFSTGINGAGNSVGLDFATTNVMKFRNVAFNADAAITAAAGTFSGQVSATTTKCSVVTVAALPAAASNAGAVSQVSDAATTLVLGLGGIVTGSGANFAPVWCDGTNWRYG